MTRSARFAPLLALVLLAACAGAPPTLASAPTAQLGQPVELSLPNEAGDLATLEAGKRVLDLWAPSCVPCQASLPALVAKKAELKAAGAELTLIAVLADSESPEDARKTLSSWGVAEPFLVDKGGAALAALGVKELPATAVTGSDGKLRWLAPGDATAEQVLAAAKSP